jgi:hypothetical protein
VAQNVSGPSHFEKPSTVPTLIDRSLILVSVPADA